MAKAHNALYSTAFWAIVVAACAIEGKPLVAFGALAVAGVCVLIAGRK